MLRTKLFSLIIIASSPLMAVEGMWQPEQLPEIKSDLSRKGLKIDPSKLTDLNSFPMNAIVSLGGCSASFVSSQGLVLTNHHCAYGSIQYNSSKEKNYLKDGFIARKLADELPASPGSRIYVTESIEDVTTRLLKGLEKSVGLNRYEVIEQRRKNLVKECETNKSYRCRVDSFLGQSSYRLTKQLEIKDVRLVQAPPSMIGKFGGDVDNWMWPRHTGDFAFYRAYVSKDGKPAAYNKSNVPYKPKGYLSIDHKGLDNGDFVMVLGYPGRTNRHRLAAEVDYTFKEYYQRIEKYLDSRIALIEGEAKNRPELSITYASRLAGLNNYSKNIKGKQEGAKSIKLSSLKKSKEAGFVNYLKKSKKTDSLKVYKEFNDLIAKNNLERDKSLSRRNVSDSSLLGIAKSLYRLAHEKKKPDAEREAGYQTRNMPRFSSRLVALDRRYDRATDIKLWSLGLSELKDTKDIPSGYNDLIKGYASKGDKFLKGMYETSILESKETRLKLMNESVEYFQKSKDPFIRLAVAVFDEELTLENESKERTGEFQRLRSQYMLKFREYVRSTGAALYSDANSTLRITYGTVQGYKNRSGESHPAFTRLEEVAAKHTGKEPFDVPEKQLKLIKAKDYGQYKFDKLGTVPVNFLADLDITGGNSGSATLNDKAELTGLVFDGTIDGVISDWAFDPAFTRSIHVDVRYILWVLDRYDGAKRLLEEMGATAPAKQTGTSHH